MKAKKLRKNGYVNENYQREEKTRDRRNVRYHRQQLVEGDGEELTGWRTWLWKLTCRNLLEESGKHVVETGELESEFQELELTNVMGIVKRQ